MEAFLTIKDPDIEKSIQKDPLREQAIWANLARQLYPHVTSVTDDIKGFIITALGLKVIEELETKHKNKNNNISFEAKEKNDIQIRYEMIIMYRLVEYNIENNLDIKFLGNSNGLDLYNSENDNPIISSDKEILVSQERLGYIGRYNSRTEDLKDEILKITFNNSQELQQKLIKAFTKVLEKGEIRYKKVNNYIKDTIIDILQVKPNQKEDYLKVLEIISNKKEKDYLNNIYEILKIDNDFDVKKVLSSNTNITLIQNILDLEPFLTCLNNIFYTLLDLDNLDDLDNNTELKDMVNKLKNSYKDKLNIFIEDYYPILIKNIKETDFKTIIYAIIDDHINIITKDGLNPWIIKYNDKYQIAHKVKRNIKETEKEFSHSYYLDAVRSLIRSMDPWKNQN